MCDCITTVNQQLAAHNTKLGVGFGVQGTKMVMRLLIQTHKLDSRVRTPAMTVSAMFCPFCGERQAALDPNPTAAAQEGGAA